MMLSDSSKKHPALSLSLETSNREPTSTGASSRTGSPKQSPRVDSPTSIGTSSSSHSPRRGLGTSTLSGEPAEAQSLPASPRSTSGASHGGAFANGTAEGRWTKEQVTNIAALRALCKEEIDASPPFPEVVGDRRILRFLNACTNNVDKAAVMYKNFLKWRKDNNADAIRQDIVYGGKNDPFKFPFGDKVLKLCPQIINSVAAMDKRGRPLALEQFNFNPSELLRDVPLKDYAVFFIHCLEMRMCMLEELSVAAETRYLEDHIDPATRKEGWGVVMYNCYIRDLKHLSRSHIGTDGRAFVKALLDIGLVNYPDVLGKAYHVNAPTIFTGVWYLIKGWLDAATVEKIAMVGGNYKDVLLAGFPVDSIPYTLGGNFTDFVESYVFDISPGAPLDYPGSDEIKAQYGIASFSRDIATLRSVEVKYRNIFSDGKVLPNELEQELEAVEQTSEPLEVEADMVDSHIYLESRTSGVVSLIIVVIAFLVGCYPVLLLCVFSSHKSGP